MQHPGTEPDLAFPHRHTIDSAARGRNDGGTVPLLGHRVCRTDRGEQRTDHGGNPCTTGSGTKRGGGERSGP